MKNIKPEKLRARKRMMQTRGKSAMNEIRMGKNGAQQSTQSVSMLSTEIRDDAKSFPMYNKISLENKTMEATTTTTKNGKTKKKINQLNQSRPQIQQIFQVPENAWMDQHLEQKTKTTTTTSCNGKTPTGLLYVDANIVTRKKYE